MRILAQRLGCSGIELADIFEAIANCAKISIVHLRLFSLKFYSAGQKKKISVQLPQSLTVKIRLNVKLKVQNNDLTHLRVSTRACFSPDSQCLGKLNFLGQTTEFYFGLSWIHVLKKED